MSMVQFGGFGGMPGLDAADYTVEAELLWKKDSGSFIVTGGMIDSATTDAGNTPTTLLRPGLLLGRIASSGKLSVWNPTGTDGTQFIYGILAAGLNMSPFGTALSKFSGPVIVSGAVKAGSIIVPGQSSAGLSGQALEHLIRHQMMGRFLLDDRFHGGVTFPRTVIAKTADYTVTENDNGTLFTNRGATGAVIFTLPATAEKGLRYGFYVVADQNVTVTAGTADTMVVFNDATADSVAFSTASKKIGAYVEVYGDGTGWLVQANQWADGTLTQTITIAT